MVDPDPAVAGGWVFLTFDGDQRGQIGRILLGIAFILPSVRMIAKAPAPNSSSTLIPVVAGGRVVKSLRPLAHEKLNKSLRLSDDGWSVLTKLHSKIISNVSWH